MSSRIYRVEVTMKEECAGHGGEDSYVTKRHLVQAQSASQAIRHVAGGMIQATVATQKDLVLLTKEKIEVEDATGEEI